MLIRLLLPHFKHKIGSINKTADWFIYSTGIFGCAPVDQREFCLHILHRLVQPTSNKLTVGSKIQYIQWRMGAPVNYTEGLKERKENGKSLGQIFILFQVVWTLLQLLLLQAPNPKIWICDHCLVRLEFIIQLCNMSFLNFWYFAEEVRLTSGRPYRKFNSKFLASSESSE